MHQTGGFERVTTGIELTGLDAGEDALEGLNIVVPLVFGAVIWFSIALMYPERGLLSLLAIIPTAIFISWVVWKRSKLNPAVPSQAWLPRWTSVLGNIGVGMFLEVIVLSIELLLLFVICVLGYSVAYTGVWDNSIHGFVDTWQEFSFFPPYFSLLPINVVLSVICSFGMFALFSEIIKYFIAQSLIMNSCNSPERIEIRRSSGEHLGQGQDEESSSDDTFLVVGIWVHQRVNLLPNSQGLLFVIIL
eukprot:TRINITY_DN694_c0_g2_i2.p2 TRINITY_DN694_c0_g2~~TRINITY_DN694_c0_g2_i2.p2  ORF type:complete len:247 (+),score=67.75 TRINITY_DN694_c0_g2_i2:1108-1848(+)